MFSCISSCRKDLGIACLWPNYPIDTASDSDGDGTSEVMRCLGHAGVILIHGESGSTRYFEFGRYDRLNIGQVRRLTVPDVSIGANGYPTEASLKRCLADLTRKAGKNSSLFAVVYEEHEAFEPAVAHAQERKAFYDQHSEDRPENHPDRYSVGSNNCVHFALDVLDEGGFIWFRITIPWLDSVPSAEIMERAGDGIASISYNPALLENPGFGEGPPRWLFIPDRFE